MGGQLSGRVGYRRGLFGRLVPQVEVWRVMHSPIPPRPGVEYKPQLRAVWRDAVASDVLALGEMVGCTAHMPPARNPPPLED